MVMPEASVLTSFVARSFAQEWRGGWETYRADSADIARTTGDSIYAPKLSSLEYSDRRQYWRASCVSVDF